MRVICQLDAFWRWIVCCRIATRTKRVYIGHAKAAIDLPSWGRGSVPAGFCLLNGTYGFYPTVDSEEEPPKKRSLAGTHALRLNPAIPSSASPSGSPLSTLFLNDLPGRSERNEKILEAPQHRICLQLIPTKCSLRYLCSVEDFRTWHAYCFFLRSELIRCNLWISYVQTKFTVSSRESVWRNSALQAERVKETPPINDNFCGDVHVWQHCWNALFFVCVTITDWAIRSDQTINIPPLHLFLFSFPSKQQRLVLFSILCVFLSSIRNE